MKRLLFFLLVVSAVLAFAAQGITFKDKAGNMELTGLSGWRAKQVDDNTIEFNGTGNPFVGKWKDQGLTLRAKTIKGTAKKKGNAFHLAEATLTGGIKGNIVRTENGVSRNNDFTCAQAVYSADTNHLDLTGGVTIVSTSASAPRSIRFTGPTVSATLYPPETKSNWAIKAATITGPVVVVIETVRTVKTGDKTEKRTVVINGRASKAVYDDVARTIVLSGGVHLDGDDNVVGGTVEASRAIISLSEKREVIGIELQGDPGRTTFHENKPRSLVR